MHKPQILNVLIFAELNSVHANFGPMNSNRPDFWSISNIIKNYIIYTYCGLGV
jgi:hypothetical protein